MLLVLELEGAIGLNRVGNWSQIKEIRQDCQCQTWWGYSDSGGLRMSEGQGLKLKGHQLYAVRQRCAERVLEGQPRGNFIYPLSILS